MRIGLGEKKNMPLMIAHSDKMIGAFMLVICALSWTWLFDALAGYLMSEGRGYLLIPAILAVFPLTGMGIVGYQLIVHESERPVELSELAKRTDSARQEIAPTPLLVNLCGIDGSGKTTQMGLIRSALAGKGIKCRCLRLRWIAFISYPLLAFCRLLGYTKWKTAKDARGNSFTYPEHQFYRNSAIARLWAWLFSFDMLLGSLIFVRIPMMMGYYVLCDRYVLDSIVDLSTETNMPNLFTSMVGRLLLALVPEGSIIIMLDVDENEALHRKNDIPSLDYLIGRRGLYLRIARAFKIPVIDALQLPSRVFREISTEHLARYPFWYLK